MTTEDRRMHEGRSRSLDDRALHDRGDEAPRGEGDAIGTGHGTPQDGAVDDIGETGSTTDREQESALGGHVGTRSGV